MFFTVPSIVTKVTSNISYNMMCDIFLSWIEEHKELP